MKRKVADADEQHLCTHHEASMLSPPSTLMDIAKLHQALEEQTINDCIEGFVAGYPLCCILEYANVTYNGGLWAHKAVNEERGRGYQGFVNYNRPTKLFRVYPLRRHTANGLEFVLSNEDIDREMLACNNFVLCAMCTKKYEDHNHYERCPLNCSIHNDKFHVHGDCVGCKPTPSCDPVLMELEKWMTSE